MNCVLQTRLLLSIEDRLLMKSYVVQQRHCVYKPKNNELSDCLFVLLHCL